MKQLIKTFLFRVCLGAQLIFTKSQEFKISKGLNLIEGEVISIKKLKKKILNLNPTYRMEKNYSL